MADPTNDGSFSNPDPGSLPGSNYNPYAPPALVEPARFGGVINGVWRDGKILVMHRLARLPDFCVKTNEPTDRRLVRRLSWAPDWVIFLALLSPLIYIVVALAISRRATIEIGISESRLARRRWTMIGSWCFVVGGFLVMFAPLMTGPDSPLPAWLIPVGIGSSLLAAIIGLASCKLVSPTKIEGDYILLKGVHPDYLARLPSLT